jgi:hypothetical protein
VEEFVCDFKNSDEQVELLCLSYISNISASNLKVVVAVLVDLCL